MVRRPASHTAHARAWSRLTADDLHFFNEGTHLRLYDKLGAHLGNVNGVVGTWFAVWAPNARRVSVFGDFNGWTTPGETLHPVERSGLWEGFVAGVKQGTLYKYHVESHLHGYAVEKADPFGTLHEQVPKTASVVWDLTYGWQDQAWMASRGERQDHVAPVSIYEVHLGSWQRVPEQSNRWLSYRELAPRLADYVTTMGFTHVELLPVMEHPFYGSWGYQTTGYFAPTSRYGTPQDFMYLIDYLHQHGIGVLLDWVPSHFPTDAHGLAFFDGTHLYEHADPRQGYHPDWQSAIPNYDRHEVRSLLLSSAHFWLDRYHADGLRVDAVASMLYRDYSRRDGEWIPNEFGGRENLGAIQFLRQLNETCYRHFPGIQMIAEESTSWTAVSRPTYIGGLGFGFKWDMGWRHDTLTYCAKDPIYRRYHHDHLTDRMLYAFNENFVLALSHDEVVHGKGSLLGRMPGDDWQKFANLRLLFGSMYGQPGKKMLFMGGEFGQWQEWNHERSLDWHLCESAPHQGVARWVADLNRLYRETPALHWSDCNPHGFEWIDCHDAEASVISWLRRGSASESVVAVVCNFTPVPRFDYRIGVPIAGAWREVLNSNARDYGGSGLGNVGRITADPVPYHGRPYSVDLTLPPLGIVFLAGPAQ
ncbi:1,4-alpha-glucan branching enzyme GlgB [Nitrospira sp.]|nr:1,4-alpha-glucan branching enzyme GlgB [Nitrospira sp.]